MRKPTLLALLLSAILGLGLLLYSPRAAAQTPINTSPQTARYLDNQWQYIPARTTLWFLFDYSGDRSIVELILIDGTPKKLQFNVWTPAQAAGRADSTNPVGRGAAPMVNCDTGKCPSNHILWKGASSEGGTYFVEVINENPVSMPYMLAIMGGSVTLRVPPPEPPALLYPRAFPAPTQPLTPTAPISPTLGLTPTVASPTPSATVTFTTPTPSVTATLTATAPITPSNVLFVLGHPPQVIADYGHRWFGFGYPAARSQVEVTIPGGADTRLLLLVYWQDANSQNSPVNFIGEASANAGDLTWVGVLSTPGNYFIQVINNNPGAQLFEVIVIGTAPGIR